VGEYSINWQAAAYQRLAFEARKAGLKIVPLDTDKAYEEIQASVDSYSRNYRLYAKREKRWEELLRKAGGGSVAVMHPSHAWRMSHLLHLPAENIFGDRSGLTKKLMVSARWYSAIERARIEAERLERRKRSARERLKRKPKF